MLMLMTMTGVRISCPTGHIFDCKLILYSLEQLLLNLPPFQRLQYHLLNHTTSPLLNLNLLAQTSPPLPLYAVNLRFLRQFPQHPLSLLTHPNLSSLRPLLLLLSYHPALLCHLSRVLNLLRSVLMLLQRTQTGDRLTQPQLVKEAHFNFRSKLVMTQEHLNPA